nr:PAS domain-containing protein [Pararoseomonas indoligenes]
MAVLWGPELIQIYNDGYRGLMGTKHPAGLGEAARECWPEAWESNAPIYRRVWAGETLTFPDKLWPVTRNGVPEDAWFTLSYSPLKGDQGAIAGILVTAIETTEHRRAEATLRESEAGFRGFVMASSDVVFRVSPDWSEMRALDGRGFIADTPDPTRDWMKAYIPPDDQAVVHAAIEAAIRSMAPFELEHRVRRVDGSLGWALSRAVPILDVEGKVTEWLGTAKDITARRWEDEAALRASEARFRGFAEASTDVLWIADGRGERLDYLSPAFEQVYGIPREVALADLSVVLDLVHPEDRATFRSAMPRAVAGETVIVHYRVVRPDGSVVHLRDTGFPIRDEAGTVMQVAGVVQDISDIALAGMALEAEKDRFRTLVEGMPQLVWRSSDEGYWTWASPQWCDYTGQSLEAGIAWGWMTAIHPDDRVRTMVAWHAARSQGHLDVEHRVRRAADGAWRWHQTRSLPVRNGPTPKEPQGRIIEWLGTTTDIQELKGLQAQQDTLVAELHHRSRNLLAIVRNLARRSLPASPERSEYDSRLSTLGRVQGFLSRAQAWSVPLRDLVNAELQAVGDGTSERVTIEGPDVTLPGDKVQTVALALHELATNAAKYGAIVQEGARLSVRWRLAGESGAKRLVLEWNESGVAMPEGGPERRGYGSELIERALPYQLGAETWRAFNADGIRCTITLPAEAFGLRETAE